jgi:hypothetical protein
MSRIVKLKFVFFALCLFASSSVFCSDGLEKTKMSQSTRGLLEIALSIGLIPVLEPLVSLVPCTTSVWCASLVTAGLFGHGFQAIAAGPKRSFGVDLYDGDLCVGGVCSEDSSGTDQEVGDLSLGAFPHLSASFEDVAASRENCWSPCQDPNSKSPIVVSGKCLENWLRTYIQEECDTGFDLSKSHYEIIERLSTLADGFPCGQEGFTCGLNIAMLHHRLCQDSECAEPSVGKWFSKEVFPWIYANRREDLMNDVIGEMNVLRRDIQILSQDINSAVVPLKAGKPVVQQLLDLFGKHKIQCSFQTGWDFTVPADQALSVAVDGDNPNGLTQGLLEVLATYFGAKSYFDRMKNGDECCFSLPSLVVCIQETGDGKVIITGFPGCPKLDKLEAFATQSEARGDQDRKCSRRYSEKMYAPETCWDATKLIVGQSARGLILGGIGAAKGLRKGLSVNLWQSAASSLWVGKHHLIPATVAALALWSSHLDSRSGVQFPEKWGGNKGMPVRTRVACFDAGLDGLTLGSPWSNAEVRDYIFAGSMDKCRYSTGNPTIVESGDYETTSRFQKRSDRTALLRRRQKRQEAFARKMARKKAAFDRKLDREKRKRDMAKKKKIEKDRREKDKLAEKKFQEQVDDSRVVFDVAPSEWLDSDGIEEGEVVVVEE